MNHSISNEGPDEFLIINNHGFPVLDAGINSGPWSMTSVDRADITDIPDDLLSLVSDYSESHGY